MGIIPREADWRPGEIRGVRLPRARRRYLCEIEYKRAGLVTPVDGDQPERCKHVKGVQGCETIFEMLGSTGFLEKLFCCHSLPPLELLLRVADGLGLDNVEIPGGGVVFLEGEGAKVTLTAHTVAGLP